MLFFKPLLLFTEMPLGEIMNDRLFKIIVCPVCNGKLCYNKKRQELICNFDALAYPLRDGIPVLLEKEARAITLDENNS